MRKKIINSLKKVAIITSETTSLFGLYQPHLSLAVRENIENGKNHEK